MIRWEEADHPDDAINIFAHHPDKGGHGEVLIASLPKGFSDTEKVKEAVDNVADCCTETEYVDCPKCNYPWAERMGTTCEEARQQGKFHDEYYDDGAYYGEVGVHFVGVKCQHCGFKDGEPCIHD